MDIPLRKAEFQCTEVIEATDQGMLWLDAELCVAGHNHAYRQLLDIADEMTIIGRPYAELLRFLLERGEFFGAQTEPYLQERLVSMQRRESLRIERVRPNGIVLTVSATPLPSGGYLYTYTDVTRERALREAQRRNAKASVIAMAGFAEHRDVDTAVHVLRVARMVGQTARKLQSHPRFSAIIDDEYIEQVATASILHDVGKIAISDSILLKPGPLTSEERSMMNLHTVLGADLLKQAKLNMGQTPYFDFGIEIALSHHERHDGQGYPHRLAGDAIPLPGRICAVVDVFDALVSRRPYKAPWEMDKVVELIRSQRSRQFDPDVADAVLAVIAERETVQLVCWQDDFSVGNLHIDEQHAVLIDTINQLASAESRRNHHVVLMIIDELASFAAFHFDYEERLMAQAAYPDLDGHKIIHQAFVSWITDLRDECLIYGTRPLGDKVLNYLRDWLKYHILGEDQRYRPFIERTGNSRRH
jgi:hemerythrin-like metal-binding protein